MKYLYITFIFLFSFFSLTAQSFQSGTIKTIDYRSIEGRILIDNTSKEVFLKKEGYTQGINFNSISNVTIDKRKYNKIGFNNEIYLGTLIVSGKASLYNLSDNSFLILKEDGEGKTFNLLNDKSQIPGMISLLFNDCNEIRKDINSIEKHSQKSLIKLTNSYNNCSYNDYNPTDKELNKANSHNIDAFRFYTGLQIGIYNTTINNNSSNITTGVGLGVGVSSSPRFLGNLYRNLYFDVDFSMSFTGPKDLINGNSPVNYELSSYYFSLGIKYSFNKEGIISPFIGLGYGFVSDYYEGHLATIHFKRSKQNYYINPKIGLYYQLKNKKHLGLTLSYIPQYENDFSFIYGSDYFFYPFEIKTSTLNVGLNYYF